MTKRNFGLKLIKSSVDINIIYFAIHEQTITICQRWTLIKSAFIDCLFIRNKVILTIMVIKAFFNVDMVPVFVY